MRSQAFQHWAGRLRPPSSATLPVCPTQSSPRFPKSILLSSNNPCLSVARLHKIRTGSDSDQPIPYLREVWSASRCLFHESTLLLVAIAPSSDFVKDPNQKPLSNLWPA